jgi:hypothetical protein
MDVRYVISELLTHYKKYEELLKKETDALIASDVERFKEIVNEKITVLEGLTEFEQKRVSVFGQLTLSELIDQHGIDKKDKDVVTLMDTITSIQELTETSKLLMDQIALYNNAILDAIKEVSNRGTTYSDDKKQSSKGQSVSLLNKKL